MHLKFQKKHLWKLILPLVLCFISLASFAHTIELRAKLNNDGSATFYARTYHGTGELPSGGFIIDGVTYPFQGVISAGALPDGSLQISACNYNFTSNDNFQYVTVPNFNSCEAHTFNCTSNAPEAPLCPLTNTLTLGAPTITLQPAFANGLACVGSASSLHVETSGTNVTYQWQINRGSGFSDLADDAVYSGTNSKTLAIGLVTANMENDVFQCVLTATDNCGNPASLSSNQVSLNPGYAVSINTQPVDQAICFGSNASFTVVASGSRLSYQWQQSNDGGASFFDLNANQATLNLSNLPVEANGNKYRAIVSGSCSTDTTSVATLIVADRAGITTQPVNVTVCESATANFSVTASGLNLTYQWEVSVDGGTSFSNVSGATGSSLELNKTIATMNGYQYRVKVGGCNGALVTTNVALLSVNTLPVVTAHPSPITICAGNNAAFSITATGSGLAFQWEESTNGGQTWIALQGKTMATLNLSSVSFSNNGHQYRCVVTGACLPAIASNAAVLTVNSLAVLTSQPQSTVVCEGNAANFAITANNTGLNYQWQVSINNGISWTNINGATNDTYSVSNATAAMNGNIYRILAMGQCGIAATSEGAVLTINTAPTVLTQPENKSVCAGSGAMFGITASGTNLTYQWQLSRDNGATWNDVANARGNTLNISNTTTGENGNQYHVIISGSCAGSVTSAAATLLVVKPVASFSFQSYCEGVPVAFTNTSTAVGTGPVKYTWNFGDGTSSTLTDTRHVFTNAGSYTVQLIATPVGCPFLSDTTEKKVVIEKAVAGVRLPTVNAIANRNIVLQPRDFAVYYNWKTTDGSINSTAKSPEVRLQKEQTVFVNMEFPSGCNTTDTLLVRFFKNDDVFVPSAFTPDGDGHNDYLKVIMVQASQLKSLRVFNRWGNLVFETNDPSKGWDGNWKGERQRGETYLWYCEAIGHDGKIIKKSGNVTLIR